MISSIFHEIIYWPPGSSRAESELNRRNICKKHLEKTDVVSHPTRSWQLNQTIGGRLPRDLRFHPWDPIAAPGRALGAQIRTWHIMALSLNTKGKTWPKPTKSINHDSSMANHMLNFISETAVWSAHSQTHLNLPVLSYRRWHCLYGTVSSIG